MRVVIAGGGSVGTSIALDLIDRHHDVTLMEQVGDRAERLKTMLPGVSVLHADACEYSSLASADVRIEPIRAQAETGYNHLSVRAACAITLDRLLGGE